MAIGSLQFIITLRNRYDLFFVGLLKLYENSSSQLVDKKIRANLETEYRGKTEHKMPTTLKTKSYVNVLSYFKC